MCYESNINSFFLTGHADTCLMKHYQPCGWKGAFEGRIYSLVAGECKAAAEVVVRVALGVIRVCAFPLFLGYTGLRGAFLKWRGMNVTLGVTEYLKTTGRQMKVAALATCFFAGNLLSLFDPVLTAELSCSLGLSRSFLLQAGKECADYRRIDYSEKATKFSVVQALVRFIGRLSKEGEKDLYEDLCVPLSQAGLTWRSSFPVIAETIKQLKGETVNSEISEHKILAAWMGVDVAYLPACESICAFFTQACCTERSFSLPELIHAVFVPCWKKQEKGKEVDVQKDLIDPILEKTGKVLASSSDVHPFASYAVSVNGVEGLNHPLQQKKDQFVEAWTQAVGERGGMVYSPGEIKKIQYRGDEQRTLLTRRGGTTVVIQDVFSCGAFSPPLQPRAGD